MHIHMIFKTHLDIGFTDYAQTVTTRYMSHFIPSAIALAERLRDEGYTERFVWTTGAWLIYEYLEQASPPERIRMEQAIARGDITWHALPFTTHTELMDASLFRFGLSLSKELDRRFGRTTIAAKMTDVPGHTRAIGLRLLVELDAPAQAHQEYGCAQTFTLEYALPNDAPHIGLCLQWFDKPATRLPEATWLSFAPRVRPSGAWCLNKMGEQIDPLDVVRYGSQHLHAVDSGVTYRDDAGGLALDTLDAPLISPGAPGLLRFGHGHASVRGGMHVNLHNTIWGTNFPQWYGENALFRFTLRVDAGI